MTKVATSLRWGIIAPEAEVIKWTAAFQKEAPEIVLEVGPEVADPASVDILYFGSIHRGVLPPLSPSNYIIL